MIVWFLVLSLYLIYMLRLLEVNVDYYHIALLDTSSLSLSSWTIINYSFLIYSSREYLWRLHQQVVMVNSLNVLLDPGHFFNFVKDLISPAFFALPEPFCNLYNWPIPFFPFPLGYCPALHPHWTVLCCRSFEVISSEWPSVTVSDLLGAFTDSGGLDMTRFSIKLWFYLSPQINFHWNG